MVEGCFRELASCGFWPGGGEEGAFYSAEFRQFLLPYEVVAGSADPDRTLTEFLQATYAAAADHGGWDRASLEDDPLRWPQHRPGQRASWGSREGSFDLR